MSRPFIPVAASLGLMLLAGSARSAGPELFHVGHPLVQRLKALYPKRVRVTDTVTGAVQTVVNEGASFQVLDGSVGEPMVSIQVDPAGIERLAGLVGAGLPADPMARLEAAAVVACASEPEFGIAAEAGGIGPKLGAPTVHYLDVKKTLDRALGFQGQAAAATSKPKKLYFGLKAKLEFEALEDWKRSFTGKLLKELAKDVKKGCTALACGGYWEAFVDAYGLLEATRSAKGEMTSVVAGLLETVKASRLHGPDSPVLAARQALLERMQALADAPCGI